MKRHLTNYPGVFYVEAKRLGGRGDERVYYVRFKRDGRAVEEKAGRQYADNMTPAKAARFRGERIEGKRPSRKEQQEKNKPAVRWTIGRLWEKYNAQRPDRKGFASDESRFTLHLKDPFGDKLPQELVPLDVDRARLKLAKEGKAAATVWNVLELLRRIVNFGVDMHLCSPPRFKIKLPGKLNNERTECASEEQLAAILEACDETDDQDGANVVRLAILMGLRRGEIVQLERDDVDPTLGFVTLRSPKGGKDARLPINPEAAAVLAAQADRSTHPTYLFPNRSGTAPLNKDVATSKARQILKTAGLGDEDFRPLHGLRHTYASMLASSGKVDLYTLQKLLTHKGPQMTQRYAHLRDEALHRAATVAGDLVRGVKKQAGKETPNEGEVRRG